jgi:nucleoside-diphosphate-sugar epimerase
MPEFTVSTKRGARQASDAVSVLLELLSNHFTYGAIARGAIKISEPDSYRPVMDVRDPVSAYFKVIESDGWRRPIYNIGSYSLAILDYAKRVQNLAPCEIVPA